MPNPNPAAPPLNPDDAPRFIPSAAFEDLTLRTPGSEIPEVLYTASDSEPFNVRLPGVVPGLAAPAFNFRIAVLLALLLLTVAAATAIYLYRDSHRSTPQASPDSSRNLSAPPSVPAAVALYPRATSTPAMTSIRIGNDSRTEKLTAHPTAA